LLRARSLQATFRTCSLVVFRTAPLHHCSRSRRVLQLEAVAQVGQHDGLAVLHDAAPDEVVAMAVELNSRYAVPLGLPSKQIADALYLSVHTVNTQGKTSCARRRRRTPPRPSVTHSSGGCCSAGGGGRYRLPGTGFLTGQSGTPGGSRPRCMALPGVEVSLDSSRAGFALPEGPLARMLRGG
jgi:hypothetical protein